MNPAHPSCRSWASPTCLSCPVSGGRLPTLHAAPHSDANMRLPAPSHARRVCGIPAHLVTCTASSQSGDYNLSLLDGLAQVPGLTLVNCANELNAAYAAGEPVCVWGGWGGGEHQ